MGGLPAHLRACPRPRREPRVYLDLKHERHSGALEHGLFPEIEKRGSFILVVTPALLTLGGSSTEEYGPDWVGDFCQLNAFVGYRFGRNRAELTLGVLNVNDADYRLSPLNPYGDLPRERTVLVRCRFTF